eukprot:TRINITY_DN5787_c0_g1_i1.p1 TRINITY_DN5787_c0_g1~~TRINITY_DN5787_c0_g1_i1.p1  ORF type:complete len:462 (+),score=116.33 TRINITY_DN5787_c0_g1_i1:124-1509(+)
MVCDSWQLGRGRRRGTEPAAALVLLASTLLVAESLRVDEDHDDAAVEEQDAAALQHAPVEFFVRLSTPLRPDVMMTCPPKMHTPTKFPYEFGWEVNIGVPHAYYLHKCGKLQGTVSCNITLADYYWFSPVHRVVTCGPVAGFYQGRRMNFEGVGVDPYLRNQPLPYWARPPHKEYYTAMPVQPRNGSAPLPPVLPPGDGMSLPPLINPFTGGDFSRYGDMSTRTPLKWPNRGVTGIAILNKQHHDWEEKEKGFLDAEVLQRVLVELKNKCPTTEVMYYRNWAFVHDEAGTIAEGTVDSKGLTEAQALASHPKMATLKSVAEANSGPSDAAFKNVPGLAEEAGNKSARLSDEAVSSLNHNARAFEHHVANNQAMSIAQVQMRVLSRFNCFIGVHGGNTELAVNFGGKMLLFLHGLPWYDTPATLARLHGIAGSKITVARSYDEIFQKLPELIVDGCSQCPLL